jgi:hypothetical protein
MSRALLVVYCARRYAIHPVTVDSRPNWDIRTLVCEIRINNIKFVISLKGNKASPLQRPTAYTCLKIKLYLP